MSHHIGRGSRDRGRHHFLCFTAAFGTDEVSVIMVLPSPKLRDHGLQIMITAIL
jgi:hypothetical protein